MKNFLGYLRILSVAFLLLSCAEESGQSYLNQQPPGDDPKLFAPNLLSPEKNFRDATFTKDGKTFYFTEIVDSTFRIMFCSYQDGQWTQPAIASFSGKYNDFEPVISRDGKYLFFGSMRPARHKLEMINDCDIWFMQASENRNGWSEPEFLSFPINTTC